MVISSVSLSVTGIGQDRSGALDLQPRPAERPERPGAPDSLGLAQLDLPALGVRVPLGPGAAEGVTMRVGVAGDVVGDHRLSSVSLRSGVSAHQSTDDERMILGGW